MGQGHALHDSADEHLVKTFGLSVSSMPGVEYSVLQLPTILSTASTVDRLDLEPYYSQIPRTVWPQQLPEGVITTPQDNPIQMEPLPPLPDLVLPMELDPQMPQ
ncbi:uncharacterized protein LOC126183395 isoform X2 [Schistocerca cancellata]|uniref:uncharacterized protein LOC126183394 isoform X3 n=1 Tax=Schistocerca cancellata TaxID=274614 RepID=UPI0021183C44|nr:uncharacterized protein LOC126183394 isoform X3 [Schistocerca cancellata]XP_049781299.1 uncharacterized protein LOC126183395 isoform X2 [Schistocerca cancellata]